MQYCLVTKNPEWQHYQRFDTISMYDSHIPR